LGTREELRDALSLCIRQYRDRHSIQQVSVMCALVDVLREPSGGSTRTGDAEKVVSYATYRAVDESGDVVKIAWPSPGISGLLKYADRVPYLFGKTFQTRVRRSPRKILFFDKAKKCYWMYRADLEEAVKVVPRGRPKRVIPGVSSGAL
jgi:hypothetical protein